MPNIDVQLVLVADTLFTSLKYANTQLQYHAGYSSLPNQPGLKIDYNWDITFDVPVHQNIYYFSATDTVLTNQYHTYLNSTVQIDSTVEYIPHFNAGFITAVTHDVAYNADTFPKRLRSTINYRDDGGWGTHTSNYFYEDTTTPIVLHIPSANSKNGSFKIIPNPASNSIRIDVAQADFNYLINDITGKIVAAGTLKANSEIDVSDLAKALTCSK